MNLRSKIGQRLMIGIRGTSLDEETRAHLKEIAPGGVILFSRNIENRAQVKNFIREIKKEVTPPPLLAIDQEGGLVVRFFREVTIMPGNMALGAVGSPELAYQQGALTAQEIKSIGFDINLAPVVDVATNPDNPGITIRSLGGDPHKVAELGVSLVQGTQSRGVGAVVKHFPGKGEASKDAHFDLPKVDLSWDEMNNLHLIPFRECVKNGVKGVMSSHVIYSNLPGVDEVPATFSQELITDYLRQKLGFEGIIFSDDLEMGAITKFFPFAEAVVKTIQAGHDMVLICSDYEKQCSASQSLITACEQDKDILSGMEDSLERIQRLRNFCHVHQYQDVQNTSFASTTLAKKIAEQSITLIRGQAFVPIKPGRMDTIYAIIPVLAKLESIEDGFEAGKSNFIVKTLQDRFSGAIKTDFVSLDPTQEEVEKAGKEAKKAELILAFIFNAKFYSGQKLLLETLKTRPQNTIFILLRNPFDVHLLDNDLTTLITYGYRKVQIEAAIKVLAGDISASGKLPITK
ncbi:MAG TPA: beta-N-acetylhexosaminidase [Thermodesulfobacteriota bacterium]|nr:beta-N-acetylhexosaminidase [Thermodesulfobacteriota bacterium]